MSKPLVVANISGFYGDRFSAPQEMIRGGHVDVLTGDYLAELTMAILYKARQKDARLGYATTFLKQIEQILGECLDRGIRIVTNAGGVNPRGLARAIEELATQLGLSPKVAVVEGDDLTARMDELERAGELFVHLDKGIPLRQVKGPVVMGHAYLGGWGIREALLRKADVVVCGRVADAALVVGPAAAYFDWKRDDWDLLAGAAAAGHILECSTQATGGNYPFFDEVPTLHDIGFPIAEIRDDGSCIITKHAGTGGLVSVGTVTAQLLYEIATPEYVTPDVIACFDTLMLTQVGPDRVQVAGCRGKPPPKTAKIAIHRVLGYKGSAGILLAGLDIDKKAAVVEECLFASLGGKAQFTSATTRLTRHPHPDPQSNEDALAELRIAVTSPDAELVGRRFSSRVVELALASVPGFTSTAPPKDATPEMLYWPSLVDWQHVHETVWIDGQTIAISTPPFNDMAVPQGGTDAGDTGTAKDVGHAFEGVVRLAVGQLFGARSGDKGGNANLGIWAKTSESYAFLHAYLTIDKLKDLLPDMAAFAVDRYELPNLLAINFVIHGWLGDGAMSSDRVDRQAKTLAEYFRCKVIAVPKGLLRESPDLKGDEDARELGWA